MRTYVKKAVWLATLLALLTVSLATVYAQKENKDKPGGQGGAMQGGMGQMMAGQAGMT